MASINNNNNNNNNNNAADGPVLLSKRFMHSDNNSHPLTATKERIRQDHNYCVEMVRDRDREGYCTFYDYFLL